MIHKIFQFVILFNTITFFLLYSTLNLDVDNTELESNLYSIFKNEELETVKLVNIKNSFYYKMVLNKKVNLIKLAKELDIIEKSN
tara:strand:- start:660 stop:914 length:255 start_codon:yes stop_codon:yes gene_type:complete